MDEVVFGIPATSPTHSTKTNGFEHKRERDENSNYNIESNGHEEESSAKRIKHE